jgi:hypothetical protein
MTFKTFWEYKQNRKKLNIESLPEKYVINNNKTDIAIIIPHRNRLVYLDKLVKHLSKLKKQPNHNYDIYLIDQNNFDGFNRGLLLNIGYYIAKKNYNYDSYIFHDIDVYPSQEIFDQYFIYVSKNVHFIPKNIDFKYNFETFFGTINSFTSHAFETINGFPNVFFQWGSEDASIYNRCFENNIKVYRPTSGTFIIEEHAPPSDNEKSKKQQQNILNDLSNWQNDGLKQLDTFFINYKKYDYNEFIKTYNHNINNLQNDAELLYTYKKNRDQINIYKIDYLCEHSKYNDKFMPKNYVEKQIENRLKEFKNPYQHKIKPMFISVIPILLYWNEIKEKILDTFTKPKKFIDNNISNKRIDKIKNILENEFLNYENNLTKQDLENTLKFIYDSYNEIIYIRIRNNKIECSYHIYSLFNQIDWYKNLKYNNKILDKSINTILEDNNKPYLTIKNPHYQPANNCLLGLDSYYYFEGNPHSYIENFIKMIKLTIKKFKLVPDCDLLLNRKDFAYLRKDNKYSYTDLLPNEEIKNKIKYWIIGSQSKTTNNLDIPIPSSDEFDTIMLNEKYNIKWENKISKVVFRGSSTGCGTNNYNNIRLKLCQTINNNILFNVKLSKLVKRIKAYKENIYIIDQQKYKHFIGSFMSNKEQANYKYIFNVEGNAQAYRYSTEFKKKSVILNIKSEYYMWFEKLLVNKRHYIEINNNLDNITDKIKYLIDNDKIAKKIAINGYRFYKKFINKDKILTYWFYYMVNLNKKIY